LTPLSTEEAERARRPELLAIATALADKGLTRERVLATYRFSHPAALSWATRRPPDPIPDSDALAILFTHPTGISIDRARAALGELAEPLLSSRLVVEHRRRAVSRLMVVPTGAGLVLADHSEQLPDAVAIADDSSYHLLGCLPERVGRWLDVGTGNGFLPLARGREPARATDVHARSIALAKLGAHLGGRTDHDFAVVDGCQDSGTFDLITLNAPLPESLGPQRTAYRREHGNVLRDFWAQARARLAEGGEILVHTVLPADDAELEGPSGGHVVATRYTDDLQDLHFGVVRWRPHGDDHVDRRARALTRAQPHLCRADVG